MSKWKSALLPSYSLLAALFMLYGCDTNSNSIHLAESNSSQSDLNASTLNDLTNYTQLFGSVSPFERLTISTPFETPSIQIDYTNIDNSQVHSQIAMRNSDGKYNFLVLPISEERSEYVAISSGETLFGQVSVLPLGLADSDYIPGQFALDAMNSILMGLRNEVTAFEDSSPPIFTSGSLEQNDNIANALQNSVDKFQTLLALVDDSVVFNSPIVDPESGESILDSRGLGILDSIFIALLDNLANQLMFLDEDSSSGNAASNPRLSFTQINQAAIERFATRDGINALVSLSMYSKDELPESSINQFVNATSLVSAGLIPAIVTNYVSRLSEFQSLEYLRESTNILDTARETTEFSYSFMYSGSLATLKALVQEVTAP